MKRVTLAAVAVVYFSGLARAVEKPLWLAVTTPQLAPSIQPLAERRRAEGLEAVVFVGEPQAALHEHPRPTYLLLVGDAPGPEEKADPAWHMPTIEMPLYRWREEQRKTFASDSKWGELDGDELPDAAVGRIAARSPDEAATVVNKIIAYEDRPWTVDDLRFPMWLGAPNYGAAVDAFAAMMILKVAESNVPRWGEPSLVAGLGASPFCGLPGEHAATYNRWLKRGGLLALVGAHGGEDYFFSMGSDDDWSGYQHSDVERDLSTGSPTCPIVLLSCLTGNFAARNRCLTEMLVLAPGGPVAAAGATTESHGMTNSLHGLAICRVLDAEPLRLGDLWLAGLRGSHSQRNVLIETVLPNVEGTLDEKIDVGRLRRDQMWMYALLGDPATRLRAPGKLSARVERAGNKWIWSAEPSADVTRMEVSFRRPMVAPPAVDGRTTTPNKAQALQDEANANFAYMPVVTLAAGQPWQGEVDRPGEVRLVAMAPDRWYVAVLKCAE